MNAEQFTLPKVRIIQQVVSDYYEIPFELMRERRRTKEVAAARQVAMQLCRKLTRHSFSDIGESFSRDHGTVICAVTSVDNWSSIDRKFRAEYDEVRELARLQIVAYEQSRFTAIQKNTASHAIASHAIAK